MNCLVTAGPENGGAKYLFCPGIHDNLHEASGFSLFDGSPDPGHRSLSSQDRPTGLLRFGIGHPDPTQRWIHIKCVGWNASTNPAMLTIEQIRRNDLVVIVGGVGEGAATVAVAERPNAVHAGGKAVIDFDVASRIEGHAGTIQSQIIRVRPASNGEKDIGADDPRLTGCAVHADRNAFWPRRKADALCVGSNSNTLTL